MYRIQCTRCGEKITGKDECECEAKAGQHVCEGKRILSDMPFDLLRRVAYGTLTETEAWAEADAR